jgi:hypothetical protein
MSQSDPERAPGVRLRNIPADAAMHGGDIRHLRMTLSTEHDARSFAGGAFLLLVLSMLLSAAPVCIAQVDGPRADTLRADTVARADSARPAPASGSDGYVMTKSPTVAVLLSIVPGGGQLYNEQYWKIPIFVGAAGFFAWQAIYAQNHFLEQAAIVDTMSADNPQLSGRKQLREIYRDNRDLNIAYYVGVEILCMIDAYVGAHLFDFNVDDNLSSRLYYDPVRNGPGLQLRW